MCEMPPVAPAASIASCAARSVAQTCVVLALERGAQRADLVAQAGGLDDRDRGLDVRVRVVGGARRRRRHLDLGDHCCGRPVHRRDHVGSRPGRPARRVHSAIRRAMSCSVSPTSASTWPRLPCSRNACGSPTARTGTSHSRSCSAWVSVVPTPPARPPSSTVTTSRCPAARSTSSVGHGQHPARVDDGDLDAVVGGPLGDRQAHRHHRADGDQQHVRHARRGAARRPGRAAPAPGCRPAARPSGSAATVGPSVTATASRSASRSVDSSRGAASRRPGTTEQDRHVPHAVVRGAVVAGHARPGRGRRSPAAGAGRRPSAAGRTPG